MEDWTMVEPAETMGAANRGQRAQARQGYGRLLRHERSVRGTGHRPKVRTLCPTTQVKDSQDLLQGKDAVMRHAVNDGSAHSGTQTPRK